MNQEDPKKFVINTLKISGGKRITEVLLRYYKFVNYYRKTPESDIIKTAEEVFGNEAKIAT